MYHVAMQLNDVDTQDSVHKSDHETNLQTEKIETAVFELSSENLHRGLDRASPKPLFTPGESCRAFQTVRAN